MVDLEFTPGRAIRLGLGPGDATVHLNAGMGVHRLDIPMTVASVRLPTDMPIQLSGDLYTELSHAAPWLGSLHLKQIATRAFEVTEYLTCSLNDSQLQGIEAARDGRDVRLRLDLKAVLLHPVDTLYPIAQTQTSISVPAAAWARQLEALGKAVVLEVLVPLPLDGSELRQAVERIREAKGHITDGRYEEAVRAARLALDYVKDAIPREDAARAQKYPPKQRTQEQRWSVLVDDLYSLASSTHHDDAVTENFAWRRDDALMIVGAVAGLLRRSARQPE
ncbi:MAG: hypothetical protein GEV11_22520 [Streptosporangiales bacterium]|nr:hypothetical protein [Streptosporangiales bacterium]